MYKKRIYIILGIMMLLLLPIVSALQYAPPPPPPPTDGTITTNWSFQYTPGPMEPTWKRFALPMNTITVPCIAKIYFNSHQHSYWPDAIYFFEDSNYNDITTWPAPATGSGAPTYVVLISTQYSSITVDITGIVWHRVSSIDYMLRD